MTDQKLIHQAHVKKIVVIPSLKDGSSKELHCLHDTAQQHIRALKVLGNKPDGPFITTLFEWQRHDQDSATVSGYDKFLEFIDLRAQASECLPLERSSRPQRSNGPRRNFQPRSATFAAGVTNNCVVCNVDKHALFTCPKFKAMNREKMMFVICNNELYVNCLNFAKHCPSPNRCRKCSKSHHMVIHDDSRDSSNAPAHATSTTSPPATSLPGKGVQHVSSN